MDNYWSTHREALEKLQLMLKNFDMSFGTSNKLFRVAIVMEILNVQCLFEQLYAKWQEDLPWGMDADADINFTEWAGYQTWADLISSARQNICIDNIPIDLGNDNCASDIAKFVKKGFNKNLKAVFKSSFSGNWQEVLEPYLALTSDKESVLSYGEMVYYAIEQLRSTLRNIDRLLRNPSDTQLLRYYDAIDQNCYPAWHPIEGKIADIHKSDLPQKKKENNLKAYRDELIKDLIRSKILDEKLEHCNNYDVKDFMNEHKDEYPEESARIIVTVDEFGDLSKDATKIKIARYLFERRHDFPVPCLYEFFAYLHGFPLVNKHLGYISVEKTNTLDPSLEQKPNVQKPLTGIDAGIYAVYQDHICNAAEWAAIVLYLDELGKMQKTAYTANAAFINKVCGEDVTSSSSLSRSTIFSQVIGKYPNWEIRATTQTRESPGKLQKYKDIVAVFIEGMKA